MSVGPGGADRGEDRAEAGGAPGRFEGLTTLDWADAEKAEAPRSAPRPAAAAKPRPRRRRATLLLAAGASLVVAVAAARVVVGPAQEADAARAEIDRQAKEKQRQLEDAERRVAALEKRREELGRQLSDGRVPDMRFAASSSRGASSGQDLAENPPDESVDLPLAGQAPPLAPERRPQTEAASDAADQVRRGEGRRAEISDGTRVFIHVLAADQEAQRRARAIAEELRRRGVAVAEIRGVPYAVRRDAVRYFYDADRGSIPTLEDAVRAAAPHGAPPVAQDFRGYPAPPRPGTVELWLS